MGVQEFSQDINNCMNHKIIVTTSTQDCCHTPSQLNFGLSKQTSIFFARLQQKYHKNVGTTMLSFFHKTYSNLVMYRKIVSQDCFLTRFNVKFDARNHLCKVEKGHKKIVYFRHKIVRTRLSQIWRKKSSLYSQESGIKSDARFWRPYKIH